MQKYKVLDLAILDYTEHVTVHLSSRGVVEHLYAAYSYHMATAHTGLHRLELTFRYYQRLYLLSVLPGFNDLRRKERITLTARFLLRTDILDAVFYQTRMQTCTMIIAWVLLVVAHLLRRSFRLRLIQQNKLTV